LEKNVRIAIVYSGQLRNYEENLVKTQVHGDVEVDIIISAWKQRGSIDRQKLNRFTAQKTIEVFGRKLRFVQVSLLRKYEILKVSEEIDEAEIRKITNLYDLRRQEKEFQNVIDGIAMPEYLIKAEPVYFRGMLSMLERNKAALKLIKKGEVSGEYDYIIRTQAEVKVDIGQLIEFLKSANPRKFYFESKTINADYQVSTKFCFSGRQNMIRYLGAIDDYLPFSEELEGELDWRRLPIGERFFFMYLTNSEIDIEPLRSDDLCEINRQQARSLWPIYIPKKIFNHLHGIQ
jgi:hypothetical protein